MVKDNLKQLTAYREKLLENPGIKEAIEIITDRSWICAYNETIQMVSEGEPGDEFPSIEKIDILFEDEMFQAEFEDNVDSWLEEFASEGGPKIAELWNLSKAPGEYLAQLIYWGNPDEGELSRPMIILAVEDGKVNNTLKSLVRDLQRDAILIPSTQIRKGHIYLDVTEISLKSLRQSYKSICTCRKRLGLERIDLQRGAPNKKDTTKALNALYLKRNGKPNKSIAGELGFKVYSADNPSGSTPLLGKYIKLGKQVEGRLIALEQYLSGVEKSIFEKMA